MINARDVIYWSIFVLWVFTPWNKPWSLINNWVGVNSLRTDKTRDQVADMGQYPFLSFTRAHVRLDITQLYPNLFSARIINPRESRRYRHNPHICTKKEKKNWGMFFDMRNFIEIFLIKFFFISFPENSQYRFHCIEKLNYKKFHSVIARFIKRIYVTRRIV